MQREMLEAAFNKLENELVLLSAELISMRHKSMQDIEDNFHHQIILPIKNVTAMAENLEASFKDKYFAAFK